MKKINREPRERSKDEIPFRDMTSAQKRSYLWDYWRWPALAVVAIVVFVVMLVHTMVTSKDYLLNVTMVDCIEDPGIENFVLDYADANEIPEDQVNVITSTLGSSETGGGASSQAGMAFYVKLQAGSEDIVIMPEDEFVEFAESGYFMDLTDIVPEEWQERLLVVEQLYDEYEDEQPEPMACAIHLSDLGIFADSDYTEDAVVAISINPANPDTAKDFLNDLLRNAKE